MEYTIGSKVLLKYYEFLGSSSEGTVYLIDKKFPAKELMSGEDIDKYYQGMTEKQKRTVRFCKFDRYGTADLNGVPVGIFPDNPRAYFKVTVLGR